MAACLWTDTSVSVQVWMEFLCHEDSTCGSLDGTKAALSSLTLVGAGIEHR